MANYDDFKKRVKEAFGTIADVSVEAYKVAEEKSRILAKKAKLNAGIANERATIRRLNVEIGATYYKLFKDNPDESLKTQCADITAAYDRIAAKQQELEDLKNCNNCEEDENCECPETDEAPTDGGCEGGVCGVNIDEEPCQKDPCEDENCETHGDKK